MNGKIIEINEENKRSSGKSCQRNSFQETLNATLEAEADQLCRAQKHQRSVERQGYRSGHYQRSLHTRAGGVKLKVPKLGKSHI